MIAAMTIFPLKAGCFRVLFVDRKNPRGVLNGLDGNVRLMDFRRRFAMHIKRKGNNSGGSIAELGLPQKLGGHFNLR